MLLTWHIYRQGHILTVWHYLPDSFTDIVYYDSMMLLDSFTDYAYYDIMMLLTWKFNWQCHILTMTLLTWQFNWQCHNLTVWHNLRDSFTDNAYYYSMTLLTWQFYWEGHILTAWQYRPHILLLHSLTWSLLTLLYSNEGN